MPDPTPTPTADPAPRVVVARAAFVLGALSAAGPWSSAPIALAIGIAAALLGLTAFPAESKKLSRILIQCCVVALGLRMDLRQLLHAAADGLLFAAATILGAFVVGILLGKLLKTGRELTILLCSGTAICGGSAIAAVGSAIGASASSMAVATGSIFLLNAGALYVFPAIGHALHLSDVQFGTWAGVAIHDVSSVVGAASGYHAATGDGASVPGASALDTANVVKLSRVLWIAPIAWAAAWWMARARRAEGDSSATAGVRKSASSFPWFVLWFVAASAARTFLPALFKIEESAIVPVLDRVKQVAGMGFQLALFLIGAGLSPAAIRAVGWRALVHALVLWIALAGAALLVARAMHT